MHGADPVDGALDLAVGAFHARARFRIQPAAQLGDGVLRHPEPGASSPSAALRRSPRGRSTLRERTAPGGCRSFRPSDGC
ncbi:hypothetical protein G6F24_016638 [Rhizopus arrhizus]|nr:hypothetical protein G6F24_016638 [Rhizopus arrhizus]